MPAQDFSKHKHFLQDDGLLASQGATHWAGGAVLPPEEATCSGLRCSLCSALPGPGSQKERPIQMDGVEPW